MSPAAVVLVVGSLGRGGTERQISQFVRASHPGLASCLVVCLSADEGDLAPEVQATGAAVRTMGFVGLSWKRPVQTLRSARAVVRLFRLLRRTEPDVVYGFMFWGYVLGLLVARFAAPHALRVAGLRSAPNLDKPSKALEPLRRLALRTAHGAITNANPTAWVERYPWLAPKLVRIPNGVEAPKLVGRRAENGRIVCIANLKPIKGHTTLFEAVALFPHDLVWTLVLCGDGPHRRSLEHRANELGLSGKVEFLGTVRDVARVLDGATLAVLASYSENLPNAVMEAMAHGVPVVATSVGDVPNLLSAGAGTLVPPGDAQALGVAIRRFLEDSELRERAGAAGRREIQSNYSITAMRDLTLAAFSSFGRRHS